MLTKAEGIYRNGQVELVELPTNIPENTRVMVTFTESEAIALATHNIDQTQAELLQVSFATFAEDWNSPEMSIYDDYDTAKAHI